MIKHISHPNARNDDYPTNLISYKTAINILSTSIKNNIHTRRYLTMSPHITRHPKTTYSNIRTYIAHELHLFSHFFFYLYIHCMHPINIQRIQHLRWTQQYYSNIYTLELCWQMGSVDRWVQLIDVTRWAHITTLWGRVIFTDVWMYQHSALLYIEYKTN